MTAPFLASPTVFLATSIHTTRVGGDNGNQTDVVRRQKFQSTPPVWVVTGWFAKGCYYIVISIHTTRVGGDLKPVNADELDEMISIHTTRVGGDYKNRGVVPGATHFNPHHPCGW